MSTAVSPFLNLPAVQSLLLSSPTSIPLLTAQIHLLSSASPETPPISSHSEPSSPSLLQARLALVRVYIDLGRLTEADSELAVAEKESRPKKKGKDGVVREWNEGEREQRRGLLRLMVHVQEGLGREGRAKVWRAKLAALDT
jgi:hypothetical protein